MEILNALRQMERFGKEPLKGLKEEWRMVRGTLSPKLKERREEKGKEAQLSVSRVKERIMIRLNYRAIIGLEGMASASMLMHAGTVMTGLKGAVIKVLLWP